MTWGLRRWLLALAGASALGAVATLVAYFLLVAQITDRHMRATLDEELWQRYSDGLTLAPEEIALIEAQLRPFDQEWIFFAGFVPAFVMAFAIGWLGSTPLLRHLAALRQTAQRVRSADLSARVPEVRPTATEIASFARDFDALVARAERAERESRASAATLAHELRTPLTIVRGRLQGMIDGVFPSGPTELAMLMTQVDVLQRLIDDLRFLTLFDAGRTSFRFELLRMDDLVHDAVAPHPALVSDLQRLDLEGDEARLTQAVSALLDNARRHAGGADHVVLRQDGHEAVLEVMDRGPGLTDAEARQVFDRFFRTDTAQSEGSGLGLSVVRTIALGHSGRALARPRPGGGTIFELRLPIKGRAASTDPP